MGGPKRSVVRASKDQRKLLFLAYEADKTPSKPRLDELGGQTGLSPDWISRWFARQRRSEKKREAQGCIDLTVKRELLDEDPIAIASVAAPLPIDARKTARRKPRKCVKKEDTPEAAPLPISSPSLQWFSPMPPSSSPPRTPTHTAGLAQAWIYDGPLSSPSRFHTRAYNSVGDSFLGAPSADTSKSQAVNVDDEQEAFWLSSFTCRVLPGNLAIPGNMACAAVREHARPGGNERTLSETARSTRVSHPCASGPTTIVTRIDQSDDAIGHGAHSIAQQGPSASRGDASFQSIPDSGRSVAPAVAQAAVDDRLELMMEELLAALDAETDVVKIAVLLSQLHRLGLRW